MNPIRLTVLAAVLAATLSTACSSKTTGDFKRGDESVSESHWSATYTSGGESIPLTLVLMSPEKSGPARLVALSAFGATLGDCLVADGRGQCRSAPGADGLMKRISEAVGAMPHQMAAFPQDSSQSPDEIGSSGWRAAGNPEGTIEYQKSSSWTLAMKKMVLK